MASNDKTAEPVSGFAKANGISIAYECFGAENKDAVLFIAGTGMQLIDWPDELMEGIAEAGFRAIRYDNCDSGLSTKFSDAGLLPFESAPGQGSCFGVRPGDPSP
jgi:pimeloyl-ACP methyl ester carboxylesterase